MVISKLVGMSVGNNHSAEKCVYGRAELTPVIEKWRVQRNGVAQDRTQ